MSYQLKIAIHSYWHPGTGRGQGSDMDAVTQRDTANKLPVLPGRSLRGLLRDAVTRWEQFAAPDAPALLAQQLFGSEPDVSADDGDSKWRSGLLRVNNAVLPYAIQHHLGEGNADLLPGLYQRLYSTAVEYGTGTAKHKSLRGIEVVVPLTLYARLDEIPGRGAVEDWPARIADALHLIDAVGAHRSRGLGRATISLEEVA